MNHDRARSWWVIWSALLIFPTAILLLHDTADLPTPLASKAYLRDSLSALHNQRPIVVDTRRGPDHSLPQSSTGGDEAVILPRNEDRMPELFFSISPASGCAPLPVVFAIDSPYAVTRQVWDFGDGIRSYQRNPVHYYTTAGEYQVSLQIHLPGMTETCQS
ncbi:MAG: PKD domain-containing protein [Planctomycetota bacterium]|nr:MAG: PKD domain-containing protein [Planctomycetota bacterium]